MIIEETVNEVQDVVTVLPLGGFRTRSRAGDVITAFNGAPIGVGEWREASRRRGV